MPKIILIRCCCLFAQTGKFRARSRLVLGDIFQNCTHNVKETTMHCHIHQSQGFKQPLPGFCTGDASKPDPMLGMQCALPDVHQRAGMLLAYNVGNLIVPYLKKAIPALFDGVGPECEIAGYMSLHSARRLENVVLSGVAVVLIVGAITFSETSRADFLQDFYSSAGAGINVTHGQAVHSSTVSGYSGGGFTWRVPRKTLQPFQIIPPSLKASCNGIDFFAGAFSFPNAEQFVQALRSFGQAALGSLFMSALKAISPMIASTVEFITDMVNKINGLQIDGCRAGMELGSKIAGSIFGDTNKAAAQENASGGATDFFKAFSDSMTNVTKMLSANNTRTTGTPAPNENQINTSEVNTMQVNFMWHALNKADQTKNLTDSDKEVIMSMVGTYIRKPGSAHDGPPAMKSETQPAILLPDIVMWGPDGLSSFNTEVYKCSPESPQRCLTMIKGSAAIQGYVKEYETLYEKLLDGVLLRRNNVLDQKSQFLLRLTSVPLWRLAGMAGTPGLAGTAARSHRKAIVHSAAMEATVATFNHFLAYATHALDKERGELSAQGEDFAREVEALKVGIREIKLILADMENNIVNEYGSPLAKIEMLTHVEKVMYGSLEIQTAANWKFSGGMR